MTAHSPYVDGKLAIEHTLSVPGGGTQALVFGDGDLLNAILTQRDYFAYKVVPSKIPLSFQRASAKARGVGHRARKLG